MVVIEVNNLELNKLKDSKKMLEITLEGIGDGVIATDSEAKITLINSVAEGLTAWSKKEAIGKKIDYVLNLVNQETKEEVANPVLQALATEEIVRLPAKTNLITKSGEQIPIDDSAAPLKDEAGNLKGAIMVFRDISKERKLKRQLEASQKFVMTVLDSIAANIVVLDEKGYIIQSNDRWLEFSKNNNGNLASSDIGVNYLEVCKTAYKDGDGDAKRAAEGIKAVINGKKDIFEFEYPCHSPDEKRWFNMRVTPLTKDYPARVVIFHIDITKRKSAEIKVEESKEKIAQSLNKGMEIHQQFLPKKLPEIENLSLASYYQPAERLGGDFYNLIKLDDKLLIYLVDITGHGLDGAMLNIFIRECINNFLLFQYQRGEELSPKEITEFIVDRYNQESFPQDYFICIAIGVLNLTEMKIKFTNAGIQIPPLVVRSNGEIASLSCSGLPITLAADKKLYENLTQEVIDLANGDLVFLTTDGLIEEVVNNEMYGEARLKSLLVNNYSLPPELIKFKINQDFKDFSGRRKGSDDITFITFKNTPTVIDSFKASITSDCKAMHKIQTEIIDFIAPYYEEYSLIQLGLQEMIINAIEHGNQMDEDKKVEIEIELTEEYIKVSITDQGSGFDWQDKIKQILDVKNDLTNKSERGRGIKMVNLLYDELWYNEKGNRANLLKFRTVD